MKNINKKVITLVLGGCMMFNAAPAFAADGYIAPIDANATKIQPRVATFTPKNTVGFYSQPGVGSPMGYFSSGEYLFEPGYGDTEATVNGVEWIYVTSFDTDLSGWVVRSNLNEVG